MRVSDLKNLQNPLAVDTDICIIGSGAAGMTLASELSGYRVLILESGGVDHESETQALYEIESTGAPRTLDQTLIRRRILGGSTHIWSGRCAPFDPVDYLKRDWVPNSGWPIDQNEINRFLERASCYLGLYPKFENLWGYVLGKRQSPPTKMSCDDMFWQASKGVAEAPVHFGRDLNPDVEILLHANVNGISEGIVDVSTIDGRKGRVKSKIIIICCGGIENARLMLVSKIGNNNVGRYLMDHIDCPIGVFERAGIEDRLGHYWLDSDNKRFSYDCGLRLSAKVQEQHQLLNCHAFILDGDDRADPWTAFGRAARARRFYKGLPSDLRSMAFGAGRIASVAYRRIVNKRPQRGRRVELHLMLEQAPYPESRVVLSDRCDALGVPLSTLHWKIGDLEKRTVVQAQELIEADLQKLGLPVPRRIPLSDDWIANTAEKAHPTGTTRMSDNPVDGVVDLNCKVHGHDGLYVAGSSVFPTAGAANPTLMIVAMSIRLADHLKSVMSTPATKSRDRIMSSGGKGRVGFIGASKRAREMHLPVLKYLGYDIIGFTSQSNASAYRMEGAAGGRRFESAEALSKECDLIIVAVSDGDSERVVSELVHLDVPLLCETPLAWTVSGVRRIIEGRQQRIGVAEQFPFLPLEQLLSKVLPYLGNVTAAINDGSVYSYHGIAQLRRYLAGNPVSVSGDRVDFDSGAKLIHRATSAHPSLRIVGTQGEFSDGKLTIEGSTQVVEREKDGSLSLAGERWQNPYPGLDDEQIAVATLIEAMQSGPLYSPTDFLADIELIQALKYASYGSSVFLPLNERREKLRAFGSPNFWRTKFGTSVN